MFKVINNANWFKSRYDIFDIFKLNVLYCYKGTRTHWFHEKVLLTSNIDLRLNEDSLFSLYDKNTRNEVSRAIKEGVEYECFNDLESKELFVQHYNEFANTVNLKNIKLTKLIKLDVNITIATYRGKVLALHCLILDKNGEYVRLLHSVSLFRAYADNSLKKMCGWANRGLHHFDIILFKLKGYSFYDFGGIASNKGITKEMENINKFKNSFGGQLTQDFHLTPYPLYYLIIIFKCLIGVKK